jgi:hypothetical protein
VQVQRVVAVLGFVCLTGFGSMSETASAAAPLTSQSRTTDRQSVCEWNRPGHDPFMGDVVGAVDRYADIPLDVRQRLKARMAKRDYDEIVSIRRDSIEGIHRYDPQIADMQFGTGRVCHEVVRTAWTAQTSERGLVYCESDQCILVPTVCRNVSRIRRTPESVALQTVEAPDPLIFAPPGAIAPPAIGEAAPPNQSFDDMLARVPGQPDVAGPGGVAPDAETPMGPEFAGFSPGFGPSYGPNYVPVGPYIIGGGTPSASSPPGTPVTVTPGVPEPGTWAMLIVGLALAGAVQRRAGRARCSTQKRP